MKSRLLLGMLALLAITLAPNRLLANNIDADAARLKANSFLKHQIKTASHGTFKPPTLADLKLTHAEASTTVSGANAYYAFNIEGGGFVIVSGEDRASLVLGYSDQGHLDFDKLPDGLKALLRSYKEEIEYLQSHPDLKVTAPVRDTNGSGVAPLIKAHWGQEMPYYLQCPVYQGEYCVVGCVATAMAQVMHYWKYPTSCSALSSYYCYSIGQTVPALPATTFDYSLMLDSYCHWDWDLSELIQDTYTDDQAQAVAKLSRYCGQAVDMSYSPDGSGAYTWSQLSAMKDFGYSSSAYDVERSSWWGTQSYTTAEWEAMVKEELDQRRPILYSANDPAAGGHAFICDGYNSEGLLHFNFGWYGTCDGWYVSTALNMTHRDGEELHFNSSHEMLLGVVPPTYCIVDADGFDTTHELLVLGHDMTMTANNVSAVASNPTVSLLFAVNNSAGRRVANSQTVSITTADFIQGSDVNSVLTLPQSLEQGIYNVEFHYFVGNPRMTTKVECGTGSLYVAGHLAKYNSPFDISDVSECINWLLLGTYPELSIEDVSDLINVLLLGM